MTIEIKLCRAFIIVSALSTVCGVARGETPAEVQELGAWCKKLGSSSKTNWLDVPYEVIVQAGLCNQNSFPASIAAGSVARYWIDRPGFATPVTRTIYMGWCLSASKEPTGANYAVCLADAESLDKAALVKELDDKKFPSLARARMGSYFDQVKKRLDASKAAWTAAVAKGPVCEEVLKTAPEKGLAEARAELEANAKALELAMSIRDKVLSHSTSDIWGRKVQVDCEELRTATRAYVASTKPQSIRDAKWALLERPVGYNLFTTLALCDTSSGKIHIGAFETKLARRPGYAPMTGERAKVRLAVWSAYRPKMSEYSCGENFPNGDLERQTYNYADPIIHIADTYSRDINEPKVLEPSDGVSRDEGFGIGTVGAIKSTPAGLEVSFKAETRFEQTMSCKNSTFWGYDSSGAPQWNSNCTWNKGTSYKVIPSSIVFDPLTMVGVKPGSVIKWTSTQMGGRPYTKTGIVVAVVRLPKGGVGESTALSYFGVPLEAPAPAAKAGKGKGK